MALAAPTAGATELPTPPDPQTAGPSGPQVPADLVPPAAAEVLGQSDALELAQLIAPERFEDPAGADPGPPAPRPSDAGEVVLMLAADESGAAAAAAIEAAVVRAGGTVLRSDDELWFVRAAVPLDRAIPLLADQAVGLADVDRVLPLPQLPAEGATAIAAETTDTGPAPPGLRTPVSAHRGG